MKLYRIMYVPKGDKGDLLFGFGWAEALVLSDKPLHHLTIEEIDASFVDRTTGISPGDSLNLCTNALCRHEDCKPTVVLFEN